MAVHYDIRLYYNFEDFRISAEWNFFPTAHGKGACDRLLGAVKRLLSRASSKLSSDDQIPNPKYLYEWCKSHILNVRSVR